MAAVNAVLLGTLMYRSGLVPRIIPLVGLIGAPLLLASDIAIMFGLWEQFSLPAGIATLPVALWELSLGVWLVVKGFKPSPITAGMVTSQIFSCTRGPATTGARASNPSVATRSSTCSSSSPVSFC
jgi:hypothetical protein